MVPYSACSTISRRELSAALIIGLEWAEKEIEYSKVAAK